MTERLQNILSKRGLASRRHAAAMILDGRVTVNQQVVLEPGFRVTLPQDVVTLDGVTVPPL
ncbi:MAG: S4 domain-containing protein, partial [Kiritimatiellia bacterium]